MPQLFISDDFKWPKPLDSYEIVPARDLLLPPGPDPFALHNPEEIPGCGLIPNTGSWPAVRGDVDFLYGEGYSRRAAGRAESIEDGMDQVFYKPFAIKPPLWMEFAQLPPEPASVLSFAAKWGFLFERTPAVEISRTHVDCSHVRHRGTRSSSHFGEAESLQDWLVLLALFGVIADLKLGIGFQHTSLLQKHVRWDGPRLHYLGASGRPIQKFTLFRPDQLKEHGIIEGDIVSAAKYHLTRIAGILMRVWSSYETDIARGPKGTTRLEIRPSTLASALALQVVSAISEGFEIGQCAVCGKWYEVRPPETRSSRKFCTTSCRMKHYRLRQKQAAQLYREGAPLAAIAEQFNTDVDNVKFWVESTRQKRTRRSLKEEGLK